MAGARAFGAYAEDATFVRLARQPRVRRADRFTHYVRVQSATVG